MANVLDCGSEINKFELQSRNYGHFQINICGKVLNPLIQLPVVMR